jgi:hypothetical protein
MEQIAATTQAALEDRVFVLEMALSSIGGALLAPNGWGDDNQLHQEVYWTVRRVLRGSPFMDVLQRRETQLEARETGGAREAADAVLNTLHTHVAESGDRVSSSEAAATRPPFD